MDEFLSHVTSRLAALPGVLAVTLGGSRAQRTHRPDSDWDMSVYYRGTFDPQHLRDIGWPGEVSELGDWGGGVYNGGAWLRIDDRPVDVHYRDLEVVDRVLAEARDGRFRIERLQFHLAGIPTYLLLAELAVNQVLHGSLERPAYPPALRANAPEVWWRTADQVFTYARDGHAKYGRTAQSIGLAVTAASQAAHAILAARGEWVTNEKTLLTRAGLRELDQLLTGPDPVAAVNQARNLCATVLDAAR
jgi:predicted nucleotidyltransferase